MANGEHLSVSNRDGATVKPRQLLLEMKRTLRVAVPLIVAQLLQMGNGLVDALVAGQLGTVELAAGGIAAGIWFVASMLCIGLLAGLSPTLSRLIGQGRRKIVGGVFRQGLWLAFAVGLCALFSLILMAATLDRWSLQPELIPFIRQYLYTACWSLPAFAVVMVSRNVFEATGLTRPVMMVQLVGLLINTLADLGFGLGWFGLPKLGLVGIGIATSVVTVSMALALIVVLRNARFRRYELFSQFDWPRWVALKDLLILSIPIYFTLLFEAGLFFATAVQMGMIGTLEAGAHNIAISMSGACYMLPLGLSFALTARTGQVYGREAWPAIRLRIVSGLILTLLMALSTALALILFRNELIRLYTNDTELHVLAARLLVLAAIFQLSDGAQVAFIGLLRGMQDTRVPMFINAFAYWGVAFPVGYLSAHHLGYGATGLWAGLIIGLSLSAVLQAWRLWTQLRRAGS